MKLEALLKRIGVSLVTAFSAVLLTFILLRFTPGSAFDGMARTMATQYAITLQEAYRRVALMYNYNPKEPILSQLGRYLGALAHGNLGSSMFYQTRTVNEIIANALPWTLFVLTISIFFSYIIGIQLGTIMAWKRKTILNPIISVYAIITNAIPQFIVAILLLVIFSFGLGWFPINGAYDPDVTPGFNLAFIVNVFYHGALPIITYIVTSIGGWSLNMKGNAVMVLGEDYINAAWMRGLSDKRIMKNYVKKNAMLPMITFVAMSFGFMISGSALIENSFGYPGMGYFIGQATGQRDYTLMQGFLLVSSLAIIIANLIADLLYAKLDPRVKLEE